MPGLRREAGPGDGPLRVPVVSAVAVAERHVRTVGTLQARLEANGAWQPSRSTHGWTPDHRRVSIWHRAKSRTQRRALLLMAAIDAGAPTAELVRLERLMVQADVLSESIG